jgi:uncharacterized protein YejL (UPF0352 family)
MTEEELNNNPEETPEATEEPLEYDQDRQKIDIGLHPINGIMLEATDAFGHTAVVKLDPQILGQLVLNLITANIMMMQQRMAMEQAEMARVSQLWKPGQ